MMSTKTQVLTDKCRRWRGKGGISSVVVVGEGVHWSGDSSSWNSSWSSSNWSSSSRLPMLNKVMSSWSVIHDAGLSHPAWRVVTVPGIVAILVGEAVLVGERSRRCERWKSTDATGLGESTADTAKRGESR